MRFTTLFAFMASLLGVHTAQASNYILDSHHTNARFEISHFSTSTNHGGFYGLTGKASFDAQKKTGEVHLNIPVKHLQTGNDKFNAHMLSPDILNAEQYPTIEYKSTTWHFNGDKPIKIDGQLTMLGITHPITLNVDRFNCYQHPMRNVRICGGDFSAHLDRTLWGINYLLKPMGKEVLLRIQAEAIPQ